MVFFLFLEKFKFNKKETMRLYWNAIYIKCFNIIHETLEESGCKVGS